MVFFEGVAVGVIFHVLTNFVKEGVLTVDEKNNDIVNFTFSQTDLKNQPVPFKIILSQNFKIRQTACDMWNLIRLLLLMLGLSILVGNEVWPCLIHFCSTCGTPMCQFIYSFRPCYFGIRNIEFLFRIH